MEEAKVLRIALESLQQQLSMLQKTLERLTEQNREMAEQNRQKDLAVSKDTRREQISPIFSSISWRWSAAYRTALRK